MWHPVRKVRSLLRPEVVVVPLDPQHGYSSSGTARLDFVGRRVLRVRLRVGGLRPFSRHPNHIHLGHCGSGGPIAFPLSTLVADRRGVAAGVTIIRGVSAIPRTGWYINVHRGPTLAGMGATPIACGNVRPGRIVTYGGDPADDAELAELMSGGPAAPALEVGPGTGEAQDTASPDDGPEAGAVELETEPETESETEPETAAGPEPQVSGPDGGEPRPGREV